MTAWPRLLRRVGATGGPLLLRTAGSALQAGVILGLAWLLEPADVGLFAVYLSVAVVLGSALDLGLPTYCLRHVAAHLERGERGKAKGLVLRAAAWATAAAAVLALAMLAARPLWHLLPMDELRPGLVGWALLAGWQTSLASLLSQSLKSLGRVPLALAAQFVLAPTVFLATGAAAYLGGGAPAMGLLFLLHNVGLAVAFAVAAAGVARACAGWRAERAAIDRPGLLRIWLAFFAQSVFLALPFLLLPALSSLEAAGLFAVAHRLVALTGNVTEVVGSIYAAQFSRAYTAGDAGALATAYGHAQRASLLWFLPLLAVYVALGKPLLGVFGAEYRAAYAALLLLALGRLVQAAAGITSYFLWMVDRAGIEAVATVAAGLALVATAVLLRGLGASGIAAAAAVGASLRNAIQYAFVRRELARLTMTPTRAAGEPS